MKVPTMQEALATLAALAKVAPEHRDRMQRWEHGDFNDTDNTAALCGTDRTILIGQLDALATGIEELRHSPHLWASAIAGLAIEAEAVEKARADLREKVEGLMEARVGGDPRMRTYSPHTIAAVLALLEEKP